MPELEFHHSGGGIHKILKPGGYLNMNMGAICRNGKKFDLLPEPFVSFSKVELEQILEKIKELEHNANPTE